MKKEFEIRKANLSDADAIWKIIHSIIKKGDTYVFSPDSSREKMLSFWFNTNQQTYVALYDNIIAGTFIIKDNQPDLGSHIANAAYMVSSDFEGLGIGKKMCEYSLEEAKEIGYYGMQFNIVIKKNFRAVNLWKKFGFEIIGEIPGAFNHVEYGLTNAYIMFKKL